MSKVIVTSLFALLGAYLGAALTRRTEYEKWLRQARTEAFASFLRELHATRLYASAAYYDEPGSALEKSIKVTESFTRLEHPLALARLFINKAAREELSSLVNKFVGQLYRRGRPRESGQPDHRPHATHSTRAGAAAQLYPMEGSVAI